MLHQLWKIIGDHLVSVILQRIPLRKEERLRGLSVFINVADERPCVESVDASAAEHQPAAVAAPGMIAVHVFGVRRVKRTDLSCGHIHYPKVGILVPD